MRVRTGLWALSFLLSCPTLATACVDEVITPGTPGFSARAADASLCLVNAERAAHGLSALQRGPATLEQPAIAFAKDMVARRFFSHESPEGVTLSQRLHAYVAGSWAVGENIAWGGGSLSTPKSIVEAWMNSPGHRANILTPRYVELGVGVVEGVPTAGLFAGATYVHDFGVRSKIPADKRSTSDSNDRPSSSNSSNGETAPEPGAAPTKPSTKKPRRKACRTKSGRHGIKTMRSGLWGRCAARKRR